MTKIVIALCLFLNGQLVEHRIQESMGTCLKLKREATRNMDMGNKQLMCGEVEAYISINIDGSETIDKIVIESK
jgi:hypothetical protein